MSLVTKLGRMVTYLELGKKDGGGGGGGWGGVFLKRG